MVNHKKHSGFTLIELMLASTLLLLVMYSGYYAYNLFNTKWEKRTAHFWQQTQKALAFDSINRLIGSIAPYIVESDSKKPAIYFEADTSRIIFITKSALFSNSLAVVEIAIENRANKFDLVYRESSIAEQVILKQSDIIQWQHQVYLFEGLSNVQYRFLGWSGYQEVLKNMQNEELAKEGEVVNIIEPKWYNQHRMENRRILPIKINFTLTHDFEERTEIDFYLPLNVHYNLIHYLREDA